MDPISTFIKNKYTVPPLNWFLARALSSAWIVDLLITTQNEALRTWQGVGVRRRRWKCTYYKKNIGILNTLR